ncbi:MAG TPA: hypothetical protein VEK15_12665 [Vicinamibacteria bacterium]|nr:hypothetical protein [Vicinamibacteria bacterium]
MLRDVEGNSFATGCAVFTDTDLREMSPKIYDRIRPGNLVTPILAQLETGAAWSVLNAEIARRIGVLDSQGESLTLSTRTGKIDGTLVKAPISLVADVGESLDLDATFFISADWRHGTFLEYSGLLEWIRLLSILTGTCSTSDSTTVPR